MSAVILISTGKSYGVSRLCRVWGRSRASVYRDLHPAPPEPPVRRCPGPQGPMTDVDLVEAISRVITDSPFYGEGHRKVWVRLRYKGIRTSKARVLRLMRENGLCAKPCQGPTHGPRAHDGTIIPDNIDKMWGTDMTGTFLGTGRQVAVFVAVDHCSAGCVGIHAAIRDTRFKARQPIRQGVRECCGAVGKNMAAGLTIRYDNGSQYIRHDFQNEIAWLGGVFIAILCPCAGRQRLRRKVHPDAERKSALDQDIRRHQGTSGCPAEVQRGLQRAMANPATWPPLTKPVQARRDGQNTRRRVSFKCVSITLGRNTTIVPQWLAKASNAMPPPARLTLLQCISETAPEALMAKVLT